MRNWIRIYCPLFMTFILVSYGFKIATKEVVVPKQLKVNEPTEVLFPKNKTIAKITTMIPATPFLGTSFIGFKEALAFKESQGNYFTINTLGYLGKYQFGIGTLQLMGVYNATRFLNNPELQEEVFQTNIARNKWILRKDISKFVGKRIRGIEVTESGILAAAHLAGAGNVKKFLRTYGRFDVSDAYGTTIRSYIKKFSGYDTSNIDAVKNPKI